MPINSRQGTARANGAGYRWFRCLDCAKQRNERSTRLLNRTQYPSDVIALVVLWRLRYKLSLRDLAEMFLIRGFVFSYEAVCGHAGRIGWHSALGRDGADVMVAGLGND